MCSLYQCQSSSEQSGQVFTPNIPDFYFTPENAANFRGTGNLTRAGAKGTTYIYTIPALSAERNCSGTLLSFQFCFQTWEKGLGTSLRVFELLNLTRDDNTFTVNRRFITEHTIARESICADIPASREKVCCTTARLQSRQLQFSASSFVLGVVLRSNRYRPLTFANEVTEFDVESFVEMSRPMPGDKFNVSLRANRPHLVLRFFLGNIIIKLL